MEDERNWSVGVGRRSIDTECPLRVLVIGYLYGITSVEIIPTNVSGACNQRRRLAGANASLKICRLMF